MRKFKYGDEVILKDRRLKYRLGKVIQVIPGGYEVLMEDKSIRYEDHSTIELRFEEDETMNELELFTRLSQIKDATTDPETAKQIVELMYERWGKNAK